MSKPDPEIRHVDPIVLRDLESKYSNVACPVHGVGPKFDIAEDGSLIETMCCDVLLKIVRELQARESEPPQG